MLTRAGFIAALADVSCKNRRREDEDEHAGFVGDEDDHDSFIAALIGCCRTCVPLTTALADWKTLRGFGPHFCRRKNALCGLHNIRRMKTTLSSAWHRHQLLAKTPAARMMKTTLPSARTQHPIERSGGRSLADWRPARPQPPSDPETTMRCDAAPISFRACCCRARARPPFPHSFCSERACWSARACGF